jgi:hypothetical protein
MSYQRTGTSPERRSVFASLRVRNYRLDARQLDV